MPQGMRSASSSTTMNASNFVVLLVSRCFQRPVIRRRFMIFLLSSTALFMVYVWHSSRYVVLTEQADVSDIQSIKDQSDQACIHPSVSLWTPELRRAYATKPPPLDCTKAEKNWVRTEGGRFRISPEAIASHGKIECKYRPIVRGNDDYTIAYGDLMMINDGDKLTTDFFEAICEASGGKSYRNKHAGVALVEAAATRRGRAIATEIPSLGMNVLMLGFDSVSRLAWMRSLPKSHAYFTDKLGGVVLEGYNIVGDGTTQALLPILTGKTEVELPESRRGFEGATFIDQYPWIWKDLRDMGYVTQFGEDSPVYGTFNYRLLGFQNQTVDHYMRTFHLAVKDDDRRPFCLKGSTPEYLEMLNWAREFYDVYRNQPKFTFVFNSELSHDVWQHLSSADNDLLDLMVYLNNTGHLDNTLFITMADHGARFADLRATDQGRLEERNPHIGIRLPKWFVAKYPEAYNNLKTNVHRLTTPFDLHATFKEIIQFTGTEEVDGKQRGISLFKEIPKDRTCADVDIEHHWCACLSWQSLDVGDPLVLRAAGEIVKHFNELTETQCDKCASLSLDVIKTAVRYGTNEGVLKFRKSLDIHGRDPDLSDSKKPAVQLYLLTLVTAPGEGVFEATATYRMHDDSFVVYSKSISRINKYGTQPHCVMDQFPHLRQFCYCITQL